MKTEDVEQVDHPNKCAKCDGRGVYDYEWDPRAIGQRASTHDKTMLFTEACPECVAKGHCPMCGATLDPRFDGFNQSCSCGWDSYTESC